MLGYKAKLFKTHVAVSIENLVPLNNFYRKVEAKVDLTFVRDLVKNSYTSHMGRPSIDPVVFFKFQLIMFFEGFRSERQLMEQVNLNLAFRWYIGYDLDETVPDHSSLSKIRDRYGLEIFQRFFEEIVERCIEAGLVWGKELYFDGTQVQANAAMESLKPRFYVEAKHHLSTLFMDPCAETQLSPEQRTPPPPTRGFVDKYSGKRITEQKTQSVSYRRITDTKASLTDPDATPMRTTTKDSARLGYHTHYVVDGGQARIILATLVTPASVMDNTPMLDLARWVRFRWQLRPAIAVGDAKYGTVYNIVGLEQDGLRAYMPPHDQGHQQHVKYYPKSMFQYDAVHNRYICPQGHPLPFKHPLRTQQQYRYRAKKATCEACPVQMHCRTGKYGRSISRSFFEEYIERVMAYQQTEAYQKAMRKRKVWPEPLFGEAKQWHTMEKFRLRRLEKVNIQALIIAAGQNLKRLLSHKTRPQPPKPVLFHRLAPPIPLAAAVSPCFLSARYGFSYSGPV
jgi:transposase